MQKKANQRKPTQRLSRSLKVFHLTIKGHDVIVPEEISAAAECLFLCRELGEQAGSPHTHVGLLLHEP